MTFQSLDLYLDEYMQHTIKTKRELVLDKAIGNIQELIKIPMTPSDEHVIPMTPSDEHVIPMTMYGNFKEEQLYGITTNRGYCTVVKIQVEGDNVTLKSQYLPNEVYQLDGSRSDRETIYIEFISEINFDIIEERLNYMHLKPLENMANILFHNSGD